ncbi:MAG: hypothetical protein WCQ95_12870 [Bacteroidota bacterium]
MKTDFYTKAVLTVIAICLTILVLKQIEIIPNANASTPKSNLNSNVNYGLVPLNSDGSVNVKLSSSSEVMHVVIDEVDKYAFRYCTVPVKVYE